MTIIKEEYILLYNRLILILLAIALLPIGFLNAQSPELWGMTSEGGQYDAGTIYKTDANGNFQDVVYSFVKYDGSTPSYDELLIGSDGLLYGVTSKGGKGFGVMYSYDPIKNVYHSLIYFDKENIGSKPHGRLLQASNGKLYGMTNQGGEYDEGVIYEYDIEKKEVRNLFDFDGPNSGANPYGGLCQALNGKLYGMTYAGGEANIGVLFEYDIERAVYSKVKDFDTEGFRPFGPVSEIFPNHLFGICTYSESGDGVIFEYNIVENTFEIRADFDRSLTGANPRGGLLKTSNGRIFGLANYGGLNDQGTLFEYLIDEDKIINRANLGSGLGQLPKGSLFEASNGHLYATTNAGGSINSGTIIKYDFNRNIIENVYNVSITGQRMQSTLIEYNGKLIGTSQDGGYSKLDGTLFEFDILNKEYNIIFEFQTFQAKAPIGSLFKSKNGKMYGIASSTRYGVDAVLFEYEKDENYLNVLHCFSTLPSANIVEYDLDRLFGCNKDWNDGFVFEYNIATNTFERKAHFDGLNGSKPEFGMTLASNNKMYGVTPEGGTNGLGVIFEYDPETNNLNAVVNFDGNEKGALPFGNPVEVEQNKLYGMTSRGGSSDDGVMYKYDIGQNTFEKVLDFSAELTGSLPFGNLLYHEGRLYGVTTNGGSHFFGVFFEFDLVSEILSIKHNFEDQITSPDAKGSLILSPNGKIYGTTSRGGQSNDGMLFEYDLVHDTFETKFEFNRTNGSNPFYSGLIVHDNKESQNLSFELEDKKYGDSPFSISAESATNNEINYYSSNSDVTTVNGNDLTINSTGTSKIWAIQAGDENYSTSYAMQVLTVEKAILKANAKNLKKGYGETNPLLIVDYEGFIGEDDESSLDIAPQASTEANQFSDAGEYYISLSTGSDNNYEIINGEDGTLTINKANLSATVENYTKIYGETNPDIIVNYEGFVGEDDESSLDIAPQASTEANQFSDAGHYNIGLSTGSDNNYEIINGEEGVLTINKANLSVTVENYTKNYGETNPDITVNYEGFVGEDDESSLDIAPQASTEANQFSDAGDYNIGLSTGSDNNYEIINGEEGILTINKANLSVTAENYKKTYGEKNPVFTLDFDGFVNDEDDTVLDEMPQVYTSANEFSEVGTYEINIVGGSDSNYKFNKGKNDLVVGTLTIDKAILEAKVDDISIVQGDVIPDFTISYAGFVNGDSEMNLDMIPYAYTTASSESSPGDYDIAINAEEDNNYNIITSNGILTINEVLQVIEKNGNQIDIFPNPAESFIQIESDQFSINQIKIFDLQGHIILAVENRTKHVDISSLESGVYIIRASNGEIQLFSRLIKK